MLEDCLNPCMFPFTHPRTIAPDYNDHYPDLGFLILLKVRSEILLSARISLENSSVAWHFPGYQPLALCAKESVDISSIGPLGPTRGDKNHSASLTNCCPSSS